MIFVTVGTQYPFDRLLAAVDEWAGRSGEQVIAQVGGSTTSFPNLKTIDFVSAEQFDSYLQSADLVIGHAGMGTIIDCAMHGRPLVILPRKHCLGEHTDDHQLGCARRMENLGLAKVVWTADEIGSALDGRKSIESRSLGHQASEKLTAALRDFVYRDREPGGFKRRPILAIASQGGHWTQLRRLQQVFDTRDVRWITTKNATGDSVGVEGVSVVRDADLQRKFQLFMLLFQVFWKILRLRPEVIVTTGSAPGWFAIVFGRIFGARSVFIDSIANAERLSISAEKSRRWADAVWTQWPDRTKPAMRSKRSVDYHGNVL